MAFTFLNVKTLLFNEDLRGSSLTRGINRFLVVDSPLHYIWSPFNKNQTMALFLLSGRSHVHHSSEHFNHFIALL